MSSSFQMENKEKIYYFSEIYEMATYFFTYI